MGIQEEIIETLRGEFLADASERIENIDDALLAAAADGAAAIVAIRREAHNLKGMGASFGFPGIGLIAHRLEDYLCGLDRIDAAHCGGVRAFLEELERIVGAGREPPNEEITAILRSLPADPDRHPAQAERPDLEVLLVTPSRVVRQIVRQALLDCGFRVTTAASVWEAIKVATLDRPDAVVTSAVMDGLGGIDLARALAAMAPTADISIAVLTSFTRDHPALKALPAGIPVVGLDERLKGDLAAAFAGFDLA